VIAALHDFDVFTAVISLPSTNFKELENVINLEARKFVPISLEDVVLDWKIVNQNGRQGNNDKQKEKDKIKEIKKDVDLDVLLTAAPRNLIKKYIEIFKSAELNLLSLETEAFAFIRALLDENDTSSLMIIDVGAVASDIIIVENQIPVVIRSIDVGGASITKAIARNLGIGFERAEQFKRDIGIYSIGNVEDNLSDQSVLRVIESTFAPVINEIHYSLDLYKTKNKSMEKIILSGGSAYLSGLADFLKSILNLPVHIGDPWYKVAYPKEMEGALKEIGSMFTVAIGLALKEIVE
jgi:type IV pilus assembly protein PilM